MIKLKNILNEAEYGTDESQYSLKERKKLRNMEEKVWKNTEKALKEQMKFYRMHRTDIKIAGFKSGDGSPLDVNNNIQFQFEEFLKNYLRKWTTLESASGPK